MHSSSKEMKQLMRKILRWAIEGALEWRQRGLDIPDTIKKASMAYLDDEDVIKAFMDEETVTVPGADVKSQDLYDRYRTWCLREGLQVEKRSHFVKELQARGWTETKRKVGKVVLGLSLA